MTKGKKKERKKENDNVSKLSIAYKPLIRRIQGYRINLLQIFLPVELVLQSKSKFFLISISIPC